MGVNDSACPNCGHRRPGLFGFAQPLRRLGADLGLVKFVVGGCVASYVATLFASRNALDAGGGAFQFLAPDLRALLLFGASGSLPIWVLGSWWTPLSASWLHGGLLHLAFNLLWLRDLGPAMAELYGVGRTVVIYVVSGIAGFLLTSAVAMLAPFLPPFLGGAQVTVGASASLFGLLGALIYYGRRTGRSWMRQTVWGWVAGATLFGFLGTFGGIHVDNWAHAGGLGGGWLAARRFDPLRDERPVHLLAAVALLLASAAAILASVWSGLRTLPL